MISVVPIYQLKCSLCGATRPPPAPLQCPVCKHVGTYADSVADLRSWNPKALSKIKTDKVERTALGDGALDHLFNGGPVNSCAYMLSAEPGFGKSRWMLQLAERFEWALYVTAEETEGALKLRASKMEIDLPGLRVVECTNLEHVMRNMTNEWDVMIIDSAQAMTTKDSLGAPGSTLQTASVIKYAADMAHQLGIVVLVVSQINKQGEAQGAMIGQHAVDGTLEGEVLGERRVITMRKHRHGPAPIKIECAMTPRGLEHFRICEKESSEDGES